MDMAHTSHPISPLQAVQPPASGSTTSHQWDLRAPRLFNLSLLSLPQLQIKIYMVCRNSSLLFLALSQSCNNRTENSSSKCVERRENVKVMKQKLCSFTPRDTSTEDISDASLSQNQPRDLESKNLSKNSHSSPVIWKGLVLSEVLTGVSIFAP